MPVQILRPLAIGDYDGWQLSAGASKMIAVDSGSPVAHDDIASYLRTPDANIKQSFTLFNKPQFVGTVTSVKIGARVAGSSQDGVTFERYMRLNGTDGTAVASQIGDGTANQDMVWLDYAPVLVARPGGGSWTAADIANTTLQMVVRQVGDPIAFYTHLTTLWVELLYDASDQIFAEDRIARGIGSRRLFAQRKPTPFVEVEVPWEFLDVELLDDLVATHDAGPITTPINSALLGSACPTSEEVSRSILLPIGDVSSSNYTAVGGSTFFEVLSDGSDSTYADGTGATANFKVTLADCPAFPAGIAYVVVKVRSSMESAASPTAYTFTLRDSGGTTIAGGNSTSFGTNQGEVHTFGQSYTTTTSSGPFTQALLTGATLEVNTGSGTNSRVQEVSVEVYPALPPMLPTADLITTGWTTTPAWSKIDDVQTDASSVLNTFSALGEPLVVQLADAAAAPASGVRLVCMYSVVTGSGTPTGTLRVSLLNSADAVMATYDTIGYWSTAAASTYWSEQSFELNAVSGLPFTQTDLTGAKLKMEVVVESASIRFEIEAAWVSFVELQEPSSFPTVESCKCETGDCAGWGVEEWKRGYLRLFEQSINFETVTMNIKLEDKRRRNVWFWNTLTNESSARGIFDGVAQLPAGIDIEYDRNSLAWIEGPSGQVVAVNQDAPKYGPGGLLIEPGATNYVLNSSFASGFTSWTQEGVGINGSSLALDTNNLLFDPAVTTNSLKFTAGNPLGGTALGISQAIALDAGDYTFSIDTIDASSSARFRMQAQRSSDSFYLNSSGTWQSGATFIDVASTSSGRYAVGFTLSGATTVTIRVVASMLAGQVNWLRHMQIENNKWATSRIVTTTTSVARAAETASFPNDAALRIFPASQGTLLVYFRAQSHNNAGLFTATGDVANKIILQVHATSGDYFRLFYDQAGRDLYARFNIGATNYDAIAYNCSLISGTSADPRPARVVVRWTGANGELGLAPYTASIFVDNLSSADPSGVLHHLKGNDVVLPGTMTEPTTSDLLLTPDAALIAGGLVSNVEDTPFVLTDDEIIGMLVE